MSGTVVAALLVGVLIYAATVYVLWKLTRPAKSAVPVHHHVISVLVGSGIVFPLAVLMVALGVAVLGALCLSVVLYIGLMIGIWDAEPWYTAIPISALLTACCISVPVLMFRISPRQKRPGHFASGRLRQ